ncbi:MAG TPA: glycoside hydrolase family 9 protein, partial [Polyangiaceae bacterium]|nr:glycoside hydrolase family 9 protein [Polyangiaceae bacterium]
QGPAPVPLPAAAAGAAVPVERYLVIDQFGYTPESAKVAVLVEPVKGWRADHRYEPAPELELRNFNDGNVVFRGKIARWNEGRLDESAGDRGSWFDFSSVQVPGTYYVYDPERKVRSHPFEIHKDVYRAVLKAATKMFYFNRANFAKVAPYACLGKKCWLQARDYAGAGQDTEARSVRAREDAKTARDLSGGWWDAGDTNKYVTFSGEAVHQLLTAYSEHPAAFRDDFGIPESGNGVPDLIDELVVELDWLKKMQPADLGGGALLKVGNVEYGDPVPDQSQLRRFYYPEPCSSATIVLASELAHAALVLKAFPRFKAYSADLVQRAARAFTYYETHPKSDACDDGTIKSGDADRSSTEQLQAAVTAAVYLFAATGQPKYAEFVDANYKSTRPFQDETWSVYDPSQADALLYYVSLPKAAPLIKAEILARLGQLAGSVDLFGFKPELDLYRAYMRSSSYHWGSNYARAATGNTNYHLVQHGLVEPSRQRDFRERALGILHSFHGVNAMQLVYLTNMYALGGDACADEAYHTWFRDGSPQWDNARTSEFGPAPGYVTGGPNKDYCQGQDPAQHACAKSPVRDQPPEKAYVDTNANWDPSNPYDKSWELTEPAIYYQAAYVRLVSKFVE